MSSAKSRGDFRIYMGIEVPSKHDADFLPENCREKRITLVTYRGVAEEQCEALLSGFAHQNNLTPTNNIHLFGEWVRTTRFANF